MSELHLSPKTLLDHIKMIDSNHNSKQALVKKYYPYLTSFDYAIPQDWLIFVANRLNLSEFEVARSFVWGYTMYSNDLGGVPLPLSESSAHWLIVLESLPE